MATSLNPAQRAGRLANARFNRTMDGDRPPHGIADIVAAIVAPTERQTLGNEDGQTGI